ncbi:beta-ketoacyl-ACP synthase II [Alicyclobacillus sp. TC]|uniref:3-oxoacyl-[acyl-carrier-protein] synthase 2 n=1 Tax=Alicyclobacillus tolerans TaxID=90970 RepID=A0ABT9LW14_9BACL|nr:MULTISPECIES: beta-ketoacyl-ACP synthase II [Alicyclobacillus]MDP9728459.1 3-oxoacyl-[acyl-carrier-protein] synthase II [Alicyclobacillus tengchongensis]QRF23755.1 beta-ketoacyl-ACP synthase II [Alicyclobacillus sp. TC]
MQKRVVVTGLGAVTPVGSTVESFWQNLLAGKSGIGLIDRFDVSEYPVRIAGQVKGFQAEDYIEKKEIRRFDMYAQFAVGAAVQALRQSGLQITEENAARVGVYIGSGIGGLQTMLENYNVLRDRGPKRVSPFLVPMMMINSASGQISIMFGAKGPNLAPVSACATGTHAVGDAYKIIARGAADAMICGGAEATICDLALAGFANMKALSTRNDSPEQASRPFDAHRDGFVMGEGAGVLVLESLESAKARGAKILAEVVGYGMSADAHHITAPDPVGFGASLAMQAALDDAGLRPEDVDYINAHGTSTDLNDKLETMAVKATFGEYAYKLSMSSIKSMTGHLLGAAGGVEAVASVMTILTGMIPPTMNYETPDPECDLDYVPNKAREQAVDTVMSNSFGFGGHNASIIIRRFMEN